MLKEKDHISDALINLVLEMRRLRNTVAHDGNVEISRVSAYEYFHLAKGVTAAFTAVAYPSIV